MGNLSCGPHFHESCPDRDYSFPIWNREGVGGSSTHKFLEKQAQTSLKMESAEISVNRILKPVTYVLAAAYFLVDAVFIAVAKPISDWLAKHLVLRKLRSWIRSLRPYPSLALFSVPVIILEPVKPIAAYLAATGEIMSSVLTLIVGELLKLVLIERLFSLTRDKLMKIPAFAWVYTKVQQAKAWLEATEAWQAIRKLSRAARSYVARMKRSGIVQFGQS